MGTVPDSFLKCGIDKILGVREKIGFIHRVYILTRRWSGSTIGEGGATDSKEEIKPVPAIVDYSHDIRIPEGGAIRQGDIMVKAISKKSYPNESEVSGNVDSPNKSIEIFYEINDRLYNVISVKENLLTWDVQVRKLSHQGEFLR